MSKFVELYGEAKLNADALMGFTPKQPKEEEKCPEKNEQTKESAPTSK